MTRLTVSEWADEYRYLPRVAAEPGKWHTERVPYLREVMDAFTDPDVWKVVLIAGAQMGKTEVLLNVAGFYVHQDPAAILVVQPNMEPMGKTWSKDRLATMLADSPCFRGLVDDPRSRDSGNTLLHKEFKNGARLTLTGANSPAGLASRPIRILLCDEVDLYEQSAGAQGDPIELAQKRTATFWHKKVGMVSVPGLKVMSKVEPAFLESDQRHYWVPCPHCHEPQTLKWKGVQWEKDENGNHLPRTAQYVCEHCGVLIDESEKQWMLDEGEWRANREFDGIAGFRMSGLYSPWVRWEEIVAEHLAVCGDTEKRKVWVNARLAETFEDEQESIDENVLKARREVYLARVPRDVAVLTGGVDVQADRLELEIKGWGVGFESWIIAHEEVRGDPGTETVWQQLEVLLVAAYEHEAGARMRLMGCCIDSGYHTDSVYRFVKSRQGRNVRATKGVSARGRPLVGVLPQKPNRAGVKVMPIGVDTAKDMLFNRLQIVEPGPGYIHISSSIGDGFIEQFGAEVVIKRFVRGMPIRSYKQIAARNEAIDLEVLNLAALHMLGTAVTEHLEHWRRKIIEAGEAAKKGEEPPKPLQRERGSSWVNRWNE